MMPARLGEVQRISIDPSRAAGELGWRAGHELGPALELTVESFR
jgi:dTDP-D-glucose 4,6-dehydratase